MAKFRYYFSDGLNVKADFSGIDPDDVTSTENGAGVALSDAYGVKVIIRLAPGERVERIDEN
jgi:hypothetical protein